MTMINKMMEYPSMVGQPVAGNSITMDATGERCGCIQFIKQAGNIAKVIFYNAAITSGDTIKASIQTVDANGVPSGTVWATATGNKAYGTVAISTSDTGWHTVTFTEVAPVVAGDIIAVVFEWNSYVAGNMRFYYNTGVSAGAGGTISYPIVVTDITASPGTWAKGSTYGASGLAMVLEYSGGTYYINTNGESSGTGASFALNTGTTPDEMGNYFQVPFTMRAYGFWLYADVDYELTLSLQSSAGTVLANRVISSSMRFGTGNGVWRINFDSDPAATVTLNASTWYRIVITPSTANSCAIWYLDVPSAAAMAVLDGGTLCYRTDRTNAGSWSETTTQRIGIGLLIDQVDIPSGSGGGLITHPGMSGGMRG